MNNNNKPRNNLSLSGFETCLNWLENKLGFKSRKNLNISVKEKICLNFLIFIFF